MELKKPRIAILASGRGSNFVAVAQAIQAGTLHADLVVLGSDKKEAGALQKAHEMGLATLVEKNQSLLLQRLQELKIEWLVLAGYMRILPAAFVESFRDSRGFSRIVNVHPSLLPAFPGLNSYQRAFEHGVKYAGVTVHFVDAGVDTGPICAQQSFPISACSSVSEVETLGLQVEHQLYPQTLQWIFQNQFQIVQRGGRLHVQPH